MTTPYPGGGGGGLPPHHGALAGPSPPALPATTATATNSIGQQSAFFPSGLRATAGLHAPSSLLVAPSPSKGVGSDGVPAMSATSATAGTSAEDALSGWKGTSTAGAPPLYHFPAALGDAAGYGRPIQGHSTSFMSPIFHFTSHDATILAMEHNNHCKMLALSTSKNEIFVTLTQLMPVVENTGATGPNDDPFAVQPAPLLDERLLEWDPAAMTVLVDRLRYPCTQLIWAPWQHGVFFAAVCPNKQIRLYRYSHGRWALDEALNTPDCTSCAFSVHFTLACACKSGKVSLLARQASPTGGEEGAWTVCGVLDPNAEDAYGAVTRGGSSGGGALRSRERRPDGERAVEPSPTSLSREPGVSAANGGGGGGGRPKTVFPPGATRRVAHDWLSVGFDEFGVLLAAGRRDGAVRVFTVLNEGTVLGPVAFAFDPPPREAPSPSSSPSLSTANTGLGECRQVAWSPSAGRSFLVLAIVYANRITLAVIRRPRLLQLAASGGGGTRGGAAPAPPLSLQLLATASVACDEVAKLSWNTTGTRFVTSHTDSSVHVWSMHVSYQQPQLPQLQGPGSVATSPQGQPSQPQQQQTQQQTQQASTNAASDMENAHSSSGGGVSTAAGGPGGAGGTGGGPSAMGRHRDGGGERGAAAMAGRALSPSTSPAPQGGNGAGGGGGTEPKPILAVSIRKVSTVHPYHAVNTK